MGILPDDLAKIHPPATRASELGGSAGAAGTPEP